MPQNFQCKHFNIFDKMGIRMIKVTGGTVLLKIWWITPRGSAEFVLLYRNKELRREMRGELPTVATRHVQWNVLLYLPAVVCTFCCTSTSTVFDVR